MPSTFFGLTIGKSGLYAAQAGINTTAHNISNATTDGFSRQVVNQSASRAISLKSSYGMAGTGVNVDSVERVRNQYFDEKFRSNNVVYGNYNTKEYYMTAIENYFSEVNSDGTTATFTQFSMALKEMANNVSDSTTRTQVAEFGANFTEYMSYLANGLQKIQEEANFDIKTTVDAVNTFAAQIASLNKQINTVEVNGGFANDLRDARDLIVDKLSELGNIKIQEIKTGNGVNVHQYVVQLDGKVLVDNYDYNTLIVSSETGRTNQCDMEGLYHIAWSNGQDFNYESKTLGGKLQALFEIRDGNNRDAFTGIAEGSAGDDSVVVRDTNCNDLNKLHLPEQDGRIQIGLIEYLYDSFEVTIEEDDDGNTAYAYTFHGLRTLENTYGLQEDVSEKQVKVGNNIDYKGVPYYQAQLNQFIRTYAARFNELHNQGEDLNGNKGCDFFNAVEKTSNCNYLLDETPTWFSSIPDSEEMSEVMQNGGSLRASYYTITGLNFSINRMITSDSRTIAAAGNIHNGVDEKSILEELIALQDDKSMFKQGKPSSFLQTFTANIAIDTKQSVLFATNQANVLNAIDNQRMSISSVDEDEEAMNLVKFQNAYELSCKIIQVMDELYDKLINGTAV